MEYRTVVSRTSILVAVFLALALVGCRGGRSQPTDSAGTPASPTAEKAAQPSDRGPNSPRPCVGSLGNTPNDGGYVLDLERCTTFALSVDSSVDFDRGVIWRPTANGIERLSADGKVTETLAGYSSVYESRDGKVRVAYSRDVPTLLVGATKDARLPSTATHARPSPDGAYVWFTEAGVTPATVTLRVLNVQSSEVTTVAPLNMETGNRRGSVDVRWSPSGRFLLARSQGDADMVYAALAKKGVGVAPLSIGWHPSRDVLPLRDAEGIAFVDFSSGKVTPIALSPTPVYVDWMHTGVAYGLIRGGGYAVLDEGGRVLANVPLSSIALYQGQAVAAWRPQAEPCPTGILVQHPSIKGEPRCYPGVSDVRWSQDGRRLLVAGGTEPYPMSVIDVVSGEALQLPAAPLSSGCGSINEVKWSADGRYLALLRLTC